jgi:hypothetical protein
MRSPSNGNCHCFRFFDGIPPRGHIDRCEQAADSVWLFAVSGSISEAGGCPGEMSERTVPPRDRLCRFGDFGLRWGLVDPPGVLSGARPAEAGPLTVEFNGNSYHDAVSASGGRRERSSE